MQKTPKFQPGEIVIFAASSTRPVLRHRVITCQDVCGAVTVEIVHGICIEPGPWLDKHDYRCSAEVVKVEEEVKIQATLF